MQLVFRPLGQWPGEPTPSYKREVARFSAHWSDTLDLLEREVIQLQRYPRSAGNVEVVLQVDADERAMRLDGGIRANATVRAPGVILSFESKHGPLTYACDRFTKGQGMGRGPAPAGWQCNVRAIALGLEALRKVDRYGIAKSGEQYRGWSQLPPARPMDAAMTIDEAAVFIAMATGDPMLSPFEVMQTWREGGRHFYQQAAKRLHPDAGGDPAEFRKLTEAKRLLDGEA